MVLQPRLAAVNKEIYGDMGLGQHMFEFGAYTLVWFGSENNLDAVGPNRLLKLILGEPYDRHIKIEIQKDLLLISNDWAGTLPIYWGQGERGIFLSSEFAMMRESIRSGFLPDSLDETGIGNLLKFSHQLGSETIFQGLQRVPAGQRLFFNYLKAGAVPKLKPAESIRPMDLSSLTFQRKIDVFRQINAEVVREALEKEEKIVLPLSSGYDSRLVLAGILDSASLRKRLITATYGPSDSIEVGSGRRLAKIAKVPWFHVSIGSDFLGKGYLREIGLKFGSTLHMHGMYQLLFWDLLSEQVDIGSATLTSGFMTGVPAGQHLDKLKEFFSEGRRGLYESLNSFSQSAHWAEKEIEILTNGGWSKQGSSQRLKTDFKNLALDNSRASMEFDIFTRQSRFISYHPDTISLRTKVASPHMNRDYVSFLWGLGEEDLQDRNFITQFFRIAHPELSSVLSNSHHFSRLGNPMLAGITLGARAMASLGVRRFTPKFMWDAPLRFDDLAAKEFGENSLWPLFEDSTRGTFEKAGLNFDFPAAHNLIDRKPPAFWYQKFLPLQSLAFDLAEIART